MTTTQELIKDAYILSGVVAAEYEDLGSGKLSKGLEILNELIDYKTGVQTLNPYIVQYDLNVGPGLGINGSSEQYFIPNLNEPDTATFQLGQVRFKLWPLPSKVYLGESRVNNLASLPSYVYFRRTKGGAYIFLYPFPNKVYPATVWGNFRVSSLDFFEVLEDIFEKYFIRYLRYALAKDLGEYWAISLPSNVLKKIDMMEKDLDKVSPIDLTANVIPTLNSRANRDDKYIIGNMYR